MRQIQLLKNFVLTLLLVLVLNFLHFWLFLENCQDEKCIRNGIFRREKYLQSRNGKYQLHLRKNGNLVFTCVARTIWTSQTVSNTVDFLYFDEDGINLILCQKDNSIIWRAPTTRPGKKLVLQDDGKLILYNSCNATIWEKGNQICSEGLF